MKLRPLIFLAVPPTRRKLKAAKRGLKISHGGCGEVRGVGMATKFKVL